MRWLRLLLHLYPAVWRERYEEEFVALLEARGLTITDIFDIMLGAWDARRHLVKKEQEQWAVTENITVKHSSVDGWRWLAGIAVLLYAIISLLSATSYLFNAPVMDESMAEGLITLSSFLLVGAVGGVGRLLIAAKHPSTQRDVRLFRGVLVALVVLVIYGWISTSQGVAPPSTIVLYALIMIVLNIWMIKQAWRAHRIGVLPRSLAVGATIMGITWLIVMLNILLSFMSMSLSRGLYPLWSMSFLVLFFVGTLWAAGLAFWLFAGHLTRLRHLREQWAS